MKFNASTISKISIYKSLDLLSRKQFRFEFLAICFSQTWLFLNAIVNCNIPFMCSAESFLVDESSVIRMKNLS